MKKEDVYQRISWSMFAFLLLLALIVPSQAAYAATEGTLTIRRFRVEDYENLRDSTGQSSDMIDVPTSAQTIEGVEFRIEKLIVAHSDTHVHTSAPIDSSFQAKTQRIDARGETTFFALAQGYYLVTEIAQGGHQAHDGRFVVRIPNVTKDSQGNEITNYEVVVYPKGKTTSVEKTVSSEIQVVGVGDIITWDVLYPMGPDLKREEIINGVTTTSYGKNFYLTDEMDTRLDYVEGSVTFRYLDKDKNEIALTLTEGIDYHLSYDAATHVLRIQFTDDVGTKKVADAEVAFIRMQLGTRVNASALDTVEVLWNNASISFENTSGDPYEHAVFPPGTNPEDSRVPKVYLGQIVLTKVDAQTSERLEGATFYLADSKANAEAGNFLTRSNAQGSQETITITTDNTGQASIRAIGAGTYYLVETVAPKGYYKLTEPIEVTVANDGNRNITQLEVSNTKEGTIPGGPGTQTPGAGEPTNPPPTGGDGGKGFASGVKTGDVVRMTGILLLAVASGGMVFVVLRRQKEKRKAVHG